MKHDITREPATTLERYGIRWSVNDPICDPMDDGYWTPWHIAQQRLDEQAAELAALNADYARLVADYNREVGEEKQRVEHLSQQLAEARKERDAAHAHACESRLEERNIRQQLAEREREIAKMKLDKKVDDMAFDSANNLYVDAKMRAEDAEAKVQQLEAALEKAAGGHPTDQDCPCAACLEQIRLV